MKRTFLIIMCALLSTTTWAQEERGGWSIMPKIGLNVASLVSYKFDRNSDEEGHSYPRLGLLLGLEAERQFDETWGMVIGIHYSMQGDRENLWRGGDKLKLIDKLDYINIPILAKVYVAKGLSVKIGLQPGFNIRHDYEFSSSNLSMYSSHEGDLSGVGINIRKFDLAIPCGISYEFNSHANRCLVTEFRCNYGLLKVADLGEEDNPWNRVFQLSLGYKFNR